MSAPPPLPAQRAPLRRALNYAWFFVVGSLLLEVAWFAVSREREVSRHNANINQIKVEDLGRDGAKGEMSYELDDGQVKYAIFDDTPPLSVDGMAYAVHLVDLERPYSAGRVWLNLNRTERMRVNLPPPSIFFVQAGHVTSTPLPSHFNLTALTAFESSGEFAAGVPGFQRWLARQTPVR